MTPPALHSVTSLLATALWLGSITDGTAQQGLGAGTPLRTEAGRPAPQISPPESQSAASTESSPQAVQPLEVMPTAQRNWEIKPRIAFQWQRDTNVFLEDKDGVVANAWTARPGVRFRRGDQDAPLRLQLDYQADFVFYDGISHQDSINHFLVSSLVYQMAKLRVGLSAELLRYTGGDFEVGGQTERLQFLPRMEVQYDITAKTAIGFYGDILRSDYETYLDFTRYRTGLFVESQVTEDTRLGLQANQVFEDVTGTGRQTAQEILLRMDYGRNSKLSVFGNAGVEIREPSDADDVVSPVGRLKVAYRPWETFQLSVDAYRTPTPSAYLEGQYFYATGLLFSASHRFFERLSLGCDFGFEHTRYESALDSVTSNREDDITLLRPWLRYSLADWASLEVFYQHTKDDSTGDDAQPFSREQTGVGLNMSW